MKTGISRRQFGSVGVVVGFATAVTAVAGSSGPSTPVADAGQSEVAVWVDGGGLAGLSPASVRLAARFAGPIDQSAVAAWADSAGLVGSSPASLRLQAVAPSIDQSAVAAWAKTQGLAGLSPASLGLPED